MKAHKDDQKARDWGNVLMDAAVSIKKAIVKARTPQMKHKSAKSAAKHLKKNRRP